MSERLSLSVDASVAPGSGSGSGIAIADTPFQETYSLALESSRVFELTADAPVSVPLPGPSANLPTPSAHILLIKAIGGKVKVAITTTDGAAQVIPVETVLILVTTGTPVTALTLTRTPGTDTFVHVFLGQI